MSIEISVTSLLTIGKINSAICLTFLHKIGGVPQWQKHVLKWFDFNFIRITLKLWLTEEDEADLASSSFVPAAPEGLDEGLGRVEVFFGKAELMHWSRKAWLEARDPWLLSSLSLSEDMDDLPPSAWKYNPQIQYTFRQIMTQAICVHCFMFRKISCTWSEIFNKYNDIFFNNNTI